MKNLGCCFKTSYFGGRWVGGRESFHVHFSQHEEEATKLSHQSGDLMGP